MCCGQSEDGRYCLSRKKGESHTRSESSGEEGHDPLIQSSETEHALGGIGASAFC